jgi:hypothetical protein
MAFLAVLSAAASAAPTDEIGQRFRWMAGCWSGNKGTTTFQEHWAPASTDLMLGMSFTTTQPGGGRSANQPSKPTEFEFLRIERRAGKATYMAQPKGAPPTPFTLSEEDSTADTSIFVNMEHDFPKRIAYKRVDASTLLAWIDAGPKGALRVEYAMKRLPCPTAGED